MSTAPKPERTFAVHEAKLALQTAIADGTSMVASREGGFMVVLTRHDVSREVTGDGFALADETQDDVPTLSKDDVLATLADTARRNRGNGDH